MLSLWLIPGLPLLGALLCGLSYLLGLRGRRSSAHVEHGHGGEHGGGQDAERVAVQEDGHGAAVAHAPLENPGVGFFALAPIAFAFALAVHYFNELRRLAPDARSIESSAWHWLDAGRMRIDLSLVLDPLSSTMTLVITGVGLLIFVYALGYMAHDAGRTKFFAYLNLFAAAMLMLVLSGNLVGLFVGWEGVGLCSYLLIGFWYQKGWPAEAGQKAFVVNRIGDACFLLGSFVLVRLFATLDLSDIAASVPAKLLDASGQAQLTLAALLLFGGCCGKSAQFPLFTWLPDAMAGPTPVSALIHAATMVTAGIYLIARLNPLYAASPTAMAVVACVGALTAVIGATSALVQRDIKRVLAYSTVSQLGYMFLALGTGSFTAALFHLVTHSFFKALLFLGAGSVIHGMHDEQDMLKMGGLKRHMPRTWITFVCGAAALSGLPLASGYFSKDEILGRAFAQGGLGVALWAVGTVAAALTAFYTWRMVALTFHGAERFDARQVQPHESPSVMTRPLQVLALLALVGGALGLPAVLHVPHLLEHWLEPVFAPGIALVRASGGGSGPSHATEVLLLVCGALVAIVFAFAGFRIYRQAPRLDEALRERQPRAFAFSESAWRIDEAYDARVTQPLKRFALELSNVFDLHVLDGAVNGAGTLARALAQRSRRLADGSVKSYALWMGAGAAALALMWILA